MRNKPKESNGHSHSSTNSWCCISTSNFLKQLCTRSDKQASTKLTIGLAILQDSLMVPPLLRHITLLKNHGSAPQFSATPV
mmetsp:Transcript_59682/g.99012  ORF Transcript_59682/g.99012 Transcript_59682/m.99012 type:complete len:81 (-) Transcript_59682:434-676(-)